jgi:predicted nucleotidyltransferase
MKVIGIICEYNPFHNGHLYHLKRAKEIAEGGIVVAVLTGYFSMRGDISVINKFDKVKTAIDNGVNITIELPYLLGTQNADIFAFNAVKLLSQMGVNEIVAGSECNDINIIKEAVNLENTISFQSDIKSYLDKGLSYRKSYSLAMEKHNLNLSSNDMLNIKYLQAINRLNNDIKLTLIQRINNNYSDIELNETNIQSATAIRGATEIENYVPEYINNIFKEKGFYNLNKFTPILKHLLLTQNLHETFQATEGIENSFDKDFTSIDNLIDILSNKRYTKSRIRRFITYILTQTTKDQMSSVHDNIIVRVTGFNEIGQQYLNKIKKEVSYFTRLINNIDITFDKELTIAKIFTNVFNEDFIKIEQLLPYRK